MQSTFQKSQRLTHPTRTTMMNFEEQPDNQDLLRMAANLANLQRHVSCHSDRQSDIDAPQQDRKEEFEPLPVEEKDSLRGESLLTALKTEYEHHRPSTLHNQNHQQKIERILEEPLTLSNCITLFELLYYFKEALEPSILLQLAQKILSTLLSNFNSSNPKEVQVYTQTISILGVQSEQLCQFVTESLLEEYMDFDLCFLVLSNQGKTGLAYLVDIVAKDITGVGNKILDYLSRSQNIVQEVIIPALLNDCLDTSLNRHRQLSLAALNRLAPILSRKWLGMLIPLLSDPSIDKKLLLSTLRCSGLEGEQLVLDLIRSKQLNENATAIALSTLSWRVPDKSVLRIKTMEYTLDHCFLPGRLYQYQGGLEPYNYEDSHCGDTLCLSSKDFLSHLEHYLKEPTSNSRILRQQEAQIQNTFSNSSLSLLTQVLNLSESLPVQMSQEVVMTLIHELKNKSAKLREIALLELGNIGEPQAASALDGVVRCLGDKQSSIRSAACWTLSKITKSSNKKIELRLTELLKDTFWKVRTSACITLGLIVSSPQGTTIEALLKCLQDGSIPKPVICQSLVRMGCSQLLLQILKSTAPNDFKLREAIITSFQFAPLNTSILNPIIQQILKHSRESRLQTRQLSLLTLSSLRTRVEKEKQYNTVTYFQSKHLLPFYYCFLDDNSRKIREIAAENILSFGAQAELLFIEGMTKGQPLAKMECIRCLGLLGVQNFRAIILGLRDEDERVRRMSSETILNNFSPEDIVSEYKGRKSHSISLICNLKEILNQKGQDKHLTTLIKTVLIRLQGQPLCFSPNLAKDNENHCLNT